MRCIELGLFEIKGYKNGVPVLALAIPADGDIKDLHPPRRPEKIDGHSPTDFNCADCADFMWRFAAYARAKRARGEDGQRTRRTQGPETEAAGTGRRWQTLVTP
jgi:hypothetical protein